MYGAVNSNIRKCRPEYLPPSGIHNYGDSLNRRLGKVLIYANPFNVDSVVQKKWSGKFLAHVHGNGNTATIGSAYIAVSDLKNKNPNAFSFALGAAETVAGGTSLRSLYEQITRACLSFELIFAAINWLLYARQSL